MPKRDAVTAEATSTVARTDQPQTREVALATAVATLDHDLMAKQNQMAEALAGTYDPRYFASVALSQFRRSPGLWDVARTMQGRVSFVDAVVQAAQYGLPFLAGRAYLVPFANHGVAEATLIVGYQGLVDLVTAPGTGVTYVEAAVVYSRDDFDYRRGTDAYLRHVPHRGAGTDGIVDRGTPTDVWAQVVYANGQARFDVMNVTEVEAIRQRSRAGRSGPWVTDWDPMACKTVLRRICKTQRINLRVMEFMDREDEAEAASRPVPISTPQQELRQRVQARLVPPEAAQASTAAEVAADAAPVPDAPPAPSVAATEEAVEGEIVPETGATDICGATVAQQATGALVECSLARGHHGWHGDGLHDWP